MGESTTWSQTHYFSPASETITLFLNNIARLQRLAVGGAEIGEIWFEAQSLGAQWCCITGDNHTPTMHLDARLFGSPEQTIVHSRTQLRAELQRLKESICLNSTRHAVPQARQALRQCLTTAQLLAYPLDCPNTSQLSEQESKPKLKESKQQSKTPNFKNSAHESQNSAPMPEI